MSANDVKHEEEDLGLDSEDEFDDSNSSYVPQKISGDIRYERRRIKELIGESLSEF